VNNTVFVDAEFGNNATAQRENLTRPFLTLAAALAAANIGDVVRVRPGVFNESQLVLRDNVDWYFEEGASIVSTSLNAIFIDASPVTCVIGGWGDFSSAGSIMEMHEVYNIQFTARNLSCSSADPMFELGPSSVSTIILQCTTMTTSGSGIMCVVDGPGTVFMSTQTTQCSNLWLLATPNSSGAVVMRSTTVTGGHVDQGLVQVNTLNAAMNVQLIAEAITTNTANTQAIQANLGDENSVSIVCDFGTFVANGGVANLIAGVPLHPFALNVSVMRSFSDVPIFIMQNMSVSIEYGVFAFGSNADITVFAGSGGLVSIDGELTANTADGTGRPTLFDIDTGIYNFHSSIVANLQAPAVLSANGAQMKFLANALSATLAVSQPTFVLNNSSLVSIGELDVKASTAPPGQLGTGIIECDGSNIVVQLGIFTYEANNIHGIHASTASRVFVDADFINTLAPGAVSSTLVLSEGELFLNARLINASFGCSFLEVGVGGHVTLDVQDVQVQAPGNGILLAANSNGLDGYLSTMRVGGSYAILNNSSSELHLTFNSIHYQGATPDAAIDLNNGGNTWLSGQELKFESAQNCMRLQGDNTHFFLDVKDVDVVVATNIVFSANSNSIATLRVSNLRAQNVGTAGFQCAGTATLNLAGEAFLITSAAVPVGIQMTENSILLAVVNYFECPDSVLNFTTTNRASYQSTQSITQNTSAVARITSNATCDYTLGGYFRTAGPNAIDITFVAQGEIRFLSSILVSTTNSIVSSAPVTVIVAPSSATFLPGPGVTIVPAGALFVDGGVS
jgi:hypothetical protein